MIPYINIPTFHLGPLPIQSFGILVALALIVGYKVSRRRAETFGLDFELVSDAIIWIAVCGFVVAHLVSVIFYFPEKVANDPLVLLRLWEGISSFGGFIGGMIGAWLFFVRRHQLSLLKYAEPITHGLVTGWIFGRLGCTTAHDHPGKVTESIFGVIGWPNQYPHPRPKKKGDKFTRYWSRLGLYGDLPWGSWTLIDLFHLDQYSGIRRYDLGLYEMVYTVVLALMLYAVRKWRPFYGAHIVLTLVAYAPVRFLFDFLRIRDELYLGLTPGQYIALSFVLLAALIARRGLRLKASGDLPPAYVDAIKTRRGASAGGASGD